MKSFRGKLFIIFVLNFDSLIFRRFIFPGHPDFLVTFSLTRTRTLRDYLLFRLSLRFDRFIKKDILNIKIGVKFCNPFFAQTIYEFANRETKLKFAGLSKSF
jgi:hypothetical protein